MMALVGRQFQIINDMLFPVDKIFYAEVTRDATLMSKLVNHIRSTAPHLLWLILPPFYFLEVKSFVVFVY